MLLILLDSVTQVVCFNCFNIFLCELSCIINWFYCNLMVTAEHFNLCCRSSNHIKLLLLLQSSMSQTWLQTWVFDRVCDKFVWVAEKFATFRVETLVANLLDLSRHVNRSIAGSQQVHESQHLRPGLRPTRVSQVWSQISILQTTNFCG